MQRQKQLWVHGGRGLGWFASGAVELGDGAEQHGFGLKVEEGAWQGRHGYGRIGEAVVMGSTPA